MLYWVTEILYGPNTGHLDVDITILSALRQLSNSQLSPCHISANDPWSLG
jgi:hypothetical protein